MITRCRNHIDRELQRSESRRGNLILFFTGTFVVPAKSGATFLGGPIERVGATSEAKNHIAIPAIEVLRGLSLCALVLTNSVSVSAFEKFGCGR